MVLFIALQKLILLLFVHFLSLWVKNLWNDFTTGQNKSDGSILWEENGRLRVIFACIHWTTKSDRVTFHHNKHDHTIIFENENGKLLCKTLYTHVSHMVYNMWQTSVVGTSYSDGRWPDAGIFMVIIYGLTLHLITRHVLLTHHGSQVPSSLATTEL